MTMPTAVIGTDAFGGERDIPSTDLGLFDIVDGVRATTHVRYVGYRVGTVPRRQHACRSSQEALFNEVYNTMASPPT